MGRGRHSQFAHGSLPDASGGIVDDPLQCLLITRIDHQPEVGDDILDLFPLIERETSIDAVGHPHLAQHLLKDTALRIGPVENGKVGIGVLLTPMQFRNLPHHLRGLHHVAVALHHRNTLPPRIHREDRLLYLPAVLLDQAIGRLHDGLRRAVVLLQLEDFRFGKGAREVEDIVNLRPAERVDALGIIAHHTDPMMNRSQLLHNGMLRQVGILILIHQDVLEPLLIEG